MPAAASRRCGPAGIGDLRIVRPSQPPDPATTAGRDGLQPPPQMLPGQRALGPDEVGRRPLEDHLAAVVAAAGTQVDHPVGPGDDVEVVLDDDHGPSRLDQPVEQADEVVDVLHVEPGGRLVEDVDLGVAGHLDRQLQPLALAARQRVELLPERHVAEPDVGETIEHDLHRPSR